MHTNILFLIAVTAFVCVGAESQLHAIQKGRHHSSSSSYGSSSSTKLGDKSTKQDDSVDTDNIQALGIVPDAQIASGMEISLATDEYDQSSLPASRQSNQTDSHDVSTLSGYPGLDMSSGSTNASSINTEDITDVVMPRIPDNLVASVEGVNDDEGQSVVIAEGEEEASIIEHIEMTLNMTAIDANPFVDAGWFAFMFHSERIGTSRPFLFESDRPVLVTLAGCVCSFDQFGIYDFDNPLFLDPATCQAASCDAALKEAGGGTLNASKLDPARLAAFRKEYRCTINWEQCTGVARLGPGAHNLTVLADPGIFSVGGGFLRIDTACIQELGEGTLETACCKLRQNCSDAVIDAHLRD